MGKIPKKPEEVRLSKRITTATTEKLKEEVKERAKEEDKSVSQFVRLSIRDKVYAETHPEADLKDLVEDGYETFSYVKGHRSEKEVSKVPKSNKNANVVSAASVLSALGYFQSLRISSKNLKDSNVVKLDFYKDKFVASYCSRAVTESVTFNGYHGNLHLFLNFDFLFNLLSNKPSYELISDLRFELDGDMVVVHFGDKEMYKIKQYSIDDGNYLSRLDIKNDKNVDSFVFPFPILREMIQSVEYAMEVKYNQTLTYVNGMEVVVDEKGFHLFTTDTYRLAYVSYLPSSGTVLHSHKVFVPVDVVYALIKKLNEVGSNEKTEVLVSNNKLDFRIKEEYLDYDMIVGDFNVNYPNFTKVTSFEDDSDVQLHLRVRADILYQSLKEVATHCNKRRELVVIEWHKDNEAIEAIKLIVKNSKGNYAKKEVSVTSIEDNISLKDDIFRMGFNPHFLMEPLKLWSVNSYAVNPYHKVDMYFMSSSALVMTPTDSDMKALTLIMPIRITKNDY